MDDFTELVPFGDDSSSKKMIPTQYKNASLELSAESQSYEDVSSVFMEMNL